MTDDTSVLVTTPESHLFEDVVGFIEGDASPRW